MSTFKIGQKVVCVDSEDYLPIIVGRTYVITKSYRDSCGCELVTVGILDLGMKSPAFAWVGQTGRCARCGSVGVLISPGNREWPFSSHRFRPIQEQSVSAKLAQEHVERIVEERPEHINEPVEA